MLFFQPATDQHAKRTHVIAEIGVNHDGCPRKAAELIIHAKQAGADSVKFQLFRAERLLSEQALLAGYQHGSAASPFDLLKALELPVQALKDLARAAFQQCLGFIVTPFSLGDVDDLSPLPITAVKIASPDAINTPLIRLALGLGRPVIVSTGTCTADELSPAVALLKQKPALAPASPADATNNQPSHALMHCVSAYPTPMDQAGLNGVKALAESTGLPCGYSDHTPSLVTGALAAALGAVVIEKHLTYDTSAAGPDHAASLRPESFHQYVQNIREADAATGPAHKSPGSLEQDVKTVSRQSVCATRDLAAGEPLKTSDLTLKRPGTGLPPSMLEHLPGKVLTRPVQANQLIHTEDLPSIPGKT